MSILLARESMWLFFHRKTRVSIASTWRRAAAARSPLIASRKGVGDGLEAMTAA